MNDFPTIPSELLEPHLVRLFSAMLRDLANCERVPELEFFQKWALRFQGVDYFLNAMQATHASIAWTNRTRPVHAAAERWSFIPKEESELARIALWTCARKAAGYE